MSNSVARPLHHIGYWVDDLEEAAWRAHRDLGIGPFALAPHISFASFVLAGRPVDEPVVFDHSAAFAAWGPIVIELGQVHEIDEGLATAEVYAEADRLGLGAFVLAMGGLVLRAGLIVAPPPVTARRTTFGRAEAGLGAGADAVGRSENRRERTRAGLDAKRDRLARGGVDREEEFPVR